MSQLDRVSPEHGDARRLPSSVRVLALALPFLLFVALLAGIEGIVRATFPHVSSLQLFVTAPDQQAGFTDRRKVSIFEGDPLLFWRLKAGLDHVIWDFTVVSTNEHGLGKSGGAWLPSPLAAETTWGDP